MFQLNNKIYDLLKWMVVIVIPAITTLYAVIDRLFGWGYAEIVTTISAATCTCIGAIIGISTAQYNSNNKGY